MGRPASSLQCVLTSVSPTQDELFKNVQRLWQIEAIPHKDDKEVTPFKQDQEALKILEAKTIRTEVNGILRLAIPLLQQKDMPQLHAPKVSVMHNLRSIEKLLFKDPLKAETYRAEMVKLKQTGAVQEVNKETTDSDECWYIPHHIISHNGEYCVVFNCSHQYHWQNLNQYLLPVLTLFQFREHPFPICRSLRVML